MVGLHGCVLECSGASSATPPLGRPYPCGSDRPLSRSAAHGRAERRSSERHPNRSHARGLGEQFRRGDAADRVQLRAPALQPDLPFSRSAFSVPRFTADHRQFKQFVDQGGYQKREYWKTPFVRDGKLVSWDEAIAVFRDTTGRPGPSTWEGGTFPTGNDDLPVSGVSWYEAAAYAEFVGKSLPTISHWFLAADIRVSPLLIPSSNFAGKGLARVGSYSSIGPFGTYNMAGNAQEWAWNEADDGFRFILGGAWSSPTYQFNQPDAKPPFDRGSANGFRCAQYPTPPRASLLGAIRRTFRDYSLEKPVGDEAFRVIRGAYAYAPRELKASVDEVDDTSPYWRKEKVSFSAAYGDVRVPAFVFLPRTPGRIERLGSPLGIHVDVRIVAATHRDLEQLVADGTFRDDLYYRLNVFPIRVPPLRDRAEDIPLLVWRFVDQFAESFGKRVETISRENMSALQRYAWPGNIRELRNVVERAMILASGRELTIAVPMAARRPRHGSSRLEDVEKDHIRAVVEAAGWRIRGASGAAKMLGLKPTTLETRMAKLGIVRPSDGATANRRSRTTYAPTGEAAYARLADPVTDRVSTG